MFKSDTSKAAPASGPPDEGEILVVTMGPHNYIGEGNAETVLKIVKSLLPPDIKRAGRRSKK